jgi:hypothetical protein
MHVPAAAVAQSGIRVASVELQQAGRVQHLRGGRASNGDVVASYSLGVVYGWYRLRRLQALRLFVLLCLGRQTRKPKS